MRIVVNYKNLRNFIFRTRLAKPTRGTVNLKQTN